MKYDYFKKEDQKCYGGKLKWIFTDYKLLD